jgi:outer membrane lipoprotein-sorting protein
MAILAAPFVVTQWPMRPSAADATVILARAARSGTVPFTGYAESTGTLPMPDTDILAATAHLLGDTNRLRVWWASATRYRVDELRTGGELDTYVDGGAVTRWDSDARSVTTLGGFTGPRLPQAPDLTPAELGRRVLADAQSGAVRIAGSERIAGRAAAALEVTANDDRSMIRAARVWVDDATGVPLRVAVTSRDGTVALQSSFRDVRFSAPDAAALSFTAPPDASYEDVPRVDVQELIERHGSPVHLPPALAGLHLRPAGTAGLTEYGGGFVRLWVLPLSAGDLYRLRSHYLSKGQEPQHMPYGDLLVITSPLVTAALVQTPAGSFAVAGTVTPAVVDTVAAAVAGGAP